MKRKSTLMAWPSIRCWDIKHFSRTCTLLIILLTGLTGSLEASHLSGGQITATRVSGNVYQVRLSVYRDCSGINLGTTQTIRLNPTVSGSSFRVSRVSVVDITPLCPGQTSVCQGGSVPGFEEHIYETNVTLTGLPIGQFYTISWQSCCRNPSITTLSTPSNDGFYLSTQINPSIANSSPTFLNVPYVALCAGQPATISPNGSDPDGDALVYSLTNCLENPTTVVSYSAGFSGSNPLTTSSGFTLNSSTGELSFTPTVGGQVAVICLLAEEFRNGVKIGEISRDIQVRVLANCSNNAPTITQVSNQIVPVGNQFCVNINASDADLDNITLTAVSSVGSFTINSVSPGNASGTFCFTPGLSNAGQTYTITIQGQDDGCPAPASASTTFNITVPIPCNGRATASGTDASCAGTSDGSATVAIQNFTPPIQYTWSNGGFTQTISGLNAGVYGVTVADANGCVDSSSVTIGGGSGNIAIGTSVTDANCGQNNGVISASGSGGTAPYTYSLSGVGSNGTGSFNNLAAGNYTLTVIDANGCDASTSVTVGFAADIQAPTLAGVPGNTIVSCDNIPAPANVTATDDCDANVTVNYAETTTAGNCPNNFTLNRTWSATDAAGNTSSLSQTITVQDLQAPTITCPNNITVANDVGDCSANVSYPAASGSDNCGSVSFTYSQASGSSFPVGTTTVSVTGVDECGNSSSCSFTVTVNDAEAPNAVCTNLAISLDANGSASITAADVDGGSSDNCGIASTSIDNSSFSCSNVGGGGPTSPSAWINEFHYDNDGADQGEFIEIAGTAGFDLTGWSVVRYNGANGAPYGTNALSGILANTSNGVGFFVINLPANGLQNGAPDGIALVDNNGGVVEFINYESNPFAATSGPATGMTSTDINVFENGNTPVGFSLQLMGSGSSAGQFTWAAPAIATPGGANSGQTFLTGSANTVTLTVTDLSGNVSNCTANITVEDAIAPTAVCQDLTIQLDNAGNASISFNDVDNGSSDNCAIDAISIDNGSFACANVGSNTVTLSVTDVNGNSSTCTSMVTVEDNIAPVAVCNDITIQLDANGNSVITTGDIDGGSSDACGIASTSLDISTFNCSSVGGGTPPSPSAWINEFHYDNDGSDQNESIEIAGTAGLDLTGWSVVRYNGANGSPYGTDALSGILANTSNGVGFFVVNLPSNGLQNGSPDGIALVDNNGSVVEFLSYEGSAFTATAGPASGQTSTNIGVAEGGSTPVGFSLQLTGSGSQSADFTWSAPSSANNGAANNGQTFTAPVAGNNVVLTVTDVNGNVSTCSAMVTVEDNVNPTAVCTDITVQLDANGNTSITASDVDGGSSDNCGIDNLSVNPSSFDCSNVGGNTVTLTVTDVNGNSSSCNANVAVEDNVDPNAVCTDITVQLDGNGSAGIVASDIDGGSNDNCGIASISASQTSFDCSNLGSNAVTLTVNDVNGNSSSCTANVEVEDNINPMITCPADLNFECSDNVPVANANDASATDNCSVASLIVVESDNGGTGCNGEQLIITRTYTATDQSGNSSSCDQTITVEATPVVTTTSPNAFVFPAYPDSACTTISVSATGGCPGYTYLWSNGATTPSQNVCPTVSTVYTVTVTDRLGCSSIDSVKVCVVDITCVGGNNNGQGGNGQGGQGSTNGNGQLHIQMCHVPNGNPNNAMTKCLPISAVQAHLAAGHGGDHLGACGSIAARDCEFGGNSKQTPSVLETQQASSLEAFPNPFNSEVKIRFVLGQDDFASVKVYDLRGVEVVTLFHDEVRAGEAQELRFQPENLAKGIYYARLTTNGGQHIVQKLIFQ